MGRRLAAGVERQKPADRHHEWVGSRMTASEAPSVI
jgi:hypothetical protein